MKYPVTMHANHPLPNAIKGKLSLQRGLSLIELMISITIGLLILASLSTLFANQTRARSELDKSNRMIDNGRYALEVLASDLRMAGYYGEFEPTAAFPPLPGALPDPCSLDPAVIQASLQLHIQGYNAADPTSLIAGLPCTLTNTPGGIRSLKAGNDVVVIRRASTTTPRVPGVALNGEFLIQSTLCQYDLTPVIVATNPASFTLRTSQCTQGSAGPLAVVRFMNVHVYFVSPDNNLNPRDGIPTLKRLELDSATQQFIVRPLVEGIEHLQIDYGRDDNFDGTADIYIAAPTLAEWPNIVAVKINVLARNNESTKGYTDTKTYSLGLGGTTTPGGPFKRHAYTQFIRLVNPAGRRE